MSDSENCFGKMGLRLTLALLLCVFLHHSTGRHFLRAFAVAPGFLCGFFDVLVLALFFRTCPFEVFFSWHKHSKLQGFLSSEASRP